MLRGTGRGRRGRRGGGQGVTIGLGVGLTGVGELLREAGRRVRPRRARVGLNMLASEDEGELGNGSGERGVGEGDGVREAAEAGSSLSSGESCSASGLAMGGAYGCASDALAG